ncbi:MAG: glycosyltransferase [Pseudarcicella sp.]|nr:glycosyltransferase [Pseudarcicella sp.]
MNILLALNSTIPVQHYGGTERVVWYLGKELVKLGHKVTLLVKFGSFCEFAKVIYLDDTKSIKDQIPADIDIIHFHYEPIGMNEISKPYVITFHGNVNSPFETNLNTIFVSKNHAARFGSKSYVYNGLDWDDYSKPNLSQKREYFHFLGKAAWRVKNVKGAIDLIKNTRTEKLKVLGGKRFNFKMGLRFTFSPRISFEDNVGGKSKDVFLNASKGLIFPVRWHEPFGLAITESLFFGCPVFGTPYGSLPEIVNSEVGFLSNSQSELQIAVENSNQFNPKTCFEYASEVFNSKIMALSYLEKYNKVISNEKLNSIAPKIQIVQKEKFLEWNK